MAPYTVLSLVVEFFGVYYTEENKENTGVCALKEFIAVKQGRTQQARIFTSVSFIFSPTPGGADGTSIFN